MTRRGTVTIVFSDVVASTELTMAVGDDAWDELRRAHFASLRAAAQRHDGEVVKSTGDGLMLVFGSTVGALDFAVDAQRDAAADAVPIRVGVSVGDATKEDDGDWYGTPVVEARRLCDAAASGTILASAVVRALAGSRGGHRFGDVESLALKGFAEAVDAVPVEWSAPAAKPPPLPRALTTARRRPLVGRAEPLARLERAWEESAEGSLRIALVAGEPGIGKTRLVAELAELADRAGGVVLAGACNEDVPAPLAPAIEALEPLVAAATSGRSLGRRANELTRLFPDLAERLPVGPPTESDPETERFLVFAAIADLLATTTVSAPTLLVLDDLHWSDPSTLDLVQYLVRANASSRLLVAGTYRDTDLGRDHRLAALLADLRREPCATRVALRGIDRDAVAEIAGDALPSALVDAVHEETDGNPFFVEEVVDHLLEEGADGRIPEGVKEVVGRRLNRLPSAANDVLAVAAIVGREFDASIVREVADVSFDVLVAAMEAASSAGVIEESGSRPGTYAFRHALIRQVLYDEQSTLRRTRLHWRVGELLAKRDGDLSSVAMHLSEGALAGDPRRAAQACLDAGISVSAHIVEARAHFKRGLALLEGEPRDAFWDDLMLNLGLTQIGSLLQTEFGRATFREVALNAEARGDARRMAMAAAMYGNLIPLARDLEFEQLSARAHRLVEPDDADSKALLLGIDATYTAVIEGRAAAQEVAARAAEAARSASDPTAVFVGLGAVAVAMFGGPDPAACDAAFDHAERAGAEPRSMLGITRLWRACVRMHLADRDGYEAAAEALEQGRSIGSGIAWWANMLRAALAVIDGRWDDAKAEASALRTAGFAGGMGMIAAAVVARSRLDQGRAGEVAAAVQASVPSGLFPTLQAWRAVAAGAAAEAGDTDTALELLDELLPPTGLAVLDNYCEHIALRHLTDVCCHLEAKDRAAALESRVKPYAGLILLGAMQMVEGAADRSLGQLAALAGRHEEAVARFEAALELERSLHADALVVRTMYWYAWARARAGDRDGARRLAGDAAEHAGRLGMRWVESAALALRD